MDSSLRTFVSRAHTSTSAGFNVDSFVFLLKEDELRVIVEARGLVWAVDALVDSKDKPTGEALKLLTATLAQMSRIREKNGQAKESRADLVDVSGPAKTLIEQAFAWEDIDLWRKVLPFCGYPPVDLAKVSVKAMDSFRVQFKDVQRG